MQLWETGEQLSLRDTQDLDYHHPLSIPASLYWSHFLRSALSTGLEAWLLAVYMFHIFSAGERLGLSPHFHSRNIRGVLFRIS